MKTLNLTLKKKWFDMIASGEKTEEYREIKPYWSVRLTTLPPEWCKNSKSVIDNSDYMNHFDNVIFKNGYSKTALSIQRKVDLIYIGTGHPEWGAEPDKKYFVIKLK